MNDRALALLAWIAALATAGCAREAERGSPTLRLAEEAAAPPFARATSVRPFHLPADHGPHFEYQTEWWYYTGNLAAAGGRHFGYQLTFFRRGLSPGPPPDGPGNASYYVGHARLLTRGRITTSAGTVEVAGTSWFDHEWSTSALGKGDLGWDWFSLQTSDERELMFFQIRREDGSLEPVSGGTLVEPDGRTRRLGVRDVQVEVEGRWTSPETGAVYPARWTVRVPSAGIELRVAPWLADQEMRTSFDYWEGAVR